MSPGAVCPGDRVFFRDDSDEAAEAGTEGDVEGIVVEALDYHATGIEGFLVLLPGGDERQVPEAALWLVYDSAQVADGGAS